MISQLQDDERTGEERKSPEAEDIPEAGGPGGPPQQIEARGFLSSTHEILVLGGWAVEDEDEESDG